VSSSSGSKSLATERHHTVGAILEDAIEVRAARRALGQVPPLHDPGFAQGDGPEPQNAYLAPEDTHTLIFHDHRGSGGPDEAEARELRAELDEVI
jgi:hypothetical protein